MGQPMEHVLRQCLIALGLAIGSAWTTTSASVFFASLVAWVGCHVDAYEQAKWFGDEMALKGDFRKVDFANAARADVHVAPPRGRAAAAPRVGRFGRAFLGEGRRAAESMLENHWRASDDLMERVGLDQVIRDTVEQSFERWDGRGVPRGLEREEILVTSRVVNLTDVVEVFYRAGGGAGGRGGGARASRHPVRS